MLMCDETITLYHQVYDADQRRKVFVPTKIDGCSWHSKLQATVADKGLKGADQYYVRIPLSQVPEGLVLAEGDIVARGNAVGDYHTPNDIRDMYDETFEVLSYSINKRGSGYVHHIRISGS